MCQGPTSSLRTPISAVIEAASSLSFDEIEVLLFARRGSEGMAKNAECNFMELLTKHWNAIAARRNADAPYRPQIDYFGDADLGQGCAQGFVTGMHLCGQAWDRLVKTDGVGELALHILALALESSSVLPGDTRTAIVEDLPDIIQEIAAYLA